MFSIVELAAYNYGEEERIFLIKNSTVETTNKNR